MNFTKYENYKDSGLEWLGEIPENWELKKLKQVAYMKGRIGWQNLRSDEFSDNPELPFLITGMNFKNGIINWSEVYHISEERYEEAPEIQLKLGDVLMTKDGTIGKLLFVDFLPGKASLNSHLLVLRAFKKDFVSKYLFYQLDSSAFRNYIEITKSGTIFHAISQEATGNYVMILPLVSEQTAIAGYLDEKTKQIDKKIELLQTKKEKYRELRKTIINEAVTKGIDNNVELKDSGVEWLGKIPKHWVVKRGKDIFEEESKKGFGDEPLLAASQKLGVVLKSKLEQRSMEATKNFDDFKFVKKGEFVISLRSFEGGIEIAHDSGIISPAYTVFSLDESLSNDYFKHLLKTDKFIGFLRSFITGIRDGQTIRFKEVGNIPFPTAPKLEQKQIADFLGEKTNKINEIILTIDKNIEALKEFRKTLINDAVTGKIKIIPAEKYAV